MFFLKKKFFPKIIFFFTFFQCNFSVRTLQCFQFFFFAHEKLKKPPKKVAQNRPRPLFPTVQPRPQPTAQNWIFILWNLGTRHLFSYLWLELSENICSGKYCNIVFIAVMWPRHFISFSTLSIKSERKESIRPDPFYCGTVTVDSSHWASKLS